MRWRSRIWYAAVACVTFVVADNLHYLTRVLDLKRYWDAQIVAGFRNFLQIGFCFLGVLIAHRFALKRSASELGLLTPVRPAFVFAFIATVPMLVAFLLTFTINPKMTLLSVGVGCLVAPFAEELLFRGFLFKQLYRRAGLGFWISALVPSVIFAVGHLYQSNDLGEMAGIAAITGLGSVLFCWIFARWKDSLWPIFFLHSLMNLWWEIFGVDESALGGWVANGSRLATVVVAIVLTIYKDRIWKLS